MTGNARNVYALVCFVLAGALAVLLLALTTFGPAGEDHDANGQEGRADDINAAAFTITGDAMKLLSPGVMVPLDLEFANARAVPLTLHDLTVTLQRVDAPQGDVDHPCTSADFTVQQMPSSSDVRLPAGSTYDLSELGVPSAEWPQVAMVNRRVNQDGCKGSTVTLAYTASAEVDDQ